jgi:hypothetical protein
MAVQKGTEASALGIWETAAVDGPVPGQGTPRGFRHFLGTPRPAHRFTAYGIDPFSAPAHLPKVRGLMNRYDQDSRGSSVPPARRPQA